MKSILEKSELEKLIQRINSIHADSINLWGRMSANQMICHLSDPIRDILGIRETVPVIPLEMQPQIKAMVLTEEQWDHNLPTFPPYLQTEDGGGTKPISFKADREYLLQLLDQFYNTPADYSFHAHAGLGILTKEEFGMYIWKHVDHHLRSFGA